jgi:hypothetical protein
LRPVPRVWVEDEWAQDELARDESGEGCPDALAVGCPDGAATDYPAVGVKGCLESVA